jgi:predicted MFS family arabinose efflux permease
MVTGVLGLSLYPLLVAAARGMPLYIAASMVGGAAWSMVGGALANYLLELAPRSDRPAHLAWYNVALNAGILLGSLAGPVLAESIGIHGGLRIGAALRLLSGASIWLAGRHARASAARLAALPVTGG